MPDLADTAADRMGVQEDCLKGTPFGTERRRNGVFRIGFHRNFFADSRDDVLSSSLFFFSSFQIPAGHILRSPWATFEDPDILCIAVSKQFQPSALPRSRGYRIHIQSRQWQSPHDDAVTRRTLWDPECFQRLASSPEHIN